MSTLTRHTSRVAKLPAKTLALTKALWILPAGTETDVRALTTLECYRVIGSDGRLGATDPQEVSTHCGKRYEQASGPRCFKLASSSSYADLLIRLHQMNIHVAEPSILTLRINKSIHLLRVESITITGISQLTEPKWITCRFDS
jgi:hypothetical protein